MARYVVAQNLNDGYITARGGTPNGGNMAAAQAGSEARQAYDGASGILRAGQWRSSPSQVQVDQALLEFGHTAIPATHLCTSASLRIYLGYTPDGDPWSLDVREDDWGGTVATDDFTPRADLPSKAALCSYPEIRSYRPAPPFWRTGAPNLRARLVDPAPLRALFYSNKQLLGYDAGGTGNEFVYLISAESSFAAQYKPSLEYFTTTVSALTRLANAAVQLSDGSAAWLELSGSNVQLRHSPSVGIYNTVATLPLGSGESQFALRNGAQVLSLVTDAQDNLFVVGPNGAAFNSITVQAFAKGSGYSWTAKTPLTAAMPTYADEINQVVATVHTTGHIVAAVGHVQTWNQSNQLVLASLSIDRALAGSGQVLVATADVPAITAGAPLVVTGNSLDIAARTGGQGALAFLPDSNTTSTERPVLGRYVISGSGAFTTVPTSFTSIAVDMPRDGDLRVKIVPAGTSQFAVLAGLAVAKVTDGGTGFTVSSVLDFESASIASLSTSHVQPLDLAYDPSTGKMWLHYLDAANSRRLMRTGIAISSWLRDNQEIQVATNTGPSGSTNLEIRIPRGLADERRLLVHLGNRGGGGAASTVAVEQTALNQIPNAPVLTNPGTFNAAGARTFSWGFSDPNPRDDQYAYQAQIRDQSSGVSMYDSGKVVQSGKSFILAGGTLSNSEVYEWRVRTYDKADQAGSWSNWQQFSTVSSGTAEIVVPNADNLPLASPDVEVSWTFSTPGTAVQAKYRLRVLRTDNNALLFDTGLVTDPATTTYQLRGLLSDVEQRIELAIEDSAGATSNTATRLVTPDYDQPVAPTLIATPDLDETGILISVINPPPTGDLPDAGRNDIYRALAGSGEYIKVGEAPKDGEFLDLSAAAGTPYEYRAYAVAGGQTPSVESANAQFDFEGVMVHDPTAPTTLQKFRFGKASKSDDSGALATTLQFVGRSFPMVEFGDQLAESVKVNIQIPFGPTHNAEVRYLRALAYSRRTILYRDARGRKVYGAIPSVQVNDEIFGSTVEFTINRVDYREEVA